jgi:hypothetical protein
VTNDGTVKVNNVVVTDSDASLTPTYVSGDDNSNGWLDPDETWVYEASGTATAGNYSNTAAASGTWPTGDGTNNTVNGNDDDSSYTGITPLIKIDKVSPLLLLLLLLLRLAAASRPGVLRRLLPGMPATLVCCAGCRQGCHRTT